MNTLNVKKIFVSAIASIYNLPQCILQLSHSIMQLTKSKIGCCVVRDQFSSRPEIKMQNENENNYVILVDKIFFFYGSRQPKWLQLGVTT